MDTVHAAKLEEMEEAKDYQDKTLKLLGAVGIIIPKVILQIKTK